MEHYEVKESPKLVLYYFPECPYCKKVLLALAELPVEVQLCNVRENPAYKMELKKLTGKSQVPCLVIDGTPLLESDSIVRFLRESTS